MRQCSCRLTNPAAPPLHSAQATSSIKPFTMENQYLDVIEQSASQLLIFTKHIHRGGTQSTFETGGPDVLPIHLCAQLWRAARIIVEASRNIGEHFLFELEL